MLTSQGQKLEAKMKETELRHKKDTEDALSTMKTSLMAERQVRECKRDSLYLCICACTYMQERGMREASRMCVKAEVIVHPKRKFYNYLIFYGRHFEDYKSHKKTNETNLTYRKYHEVLSIISAGHDISTLFLIGSFYFPIKSTK